MQNKVSERVSRMASSCCPHCSCLCEQLIKAGAQQQQRSRAQDHTDISPLYTMDIALLKHQYNTMRDKQKQETRVICFRKAASGDEEHSGKSLVSVVPMRQVQRSHMKQTSFEETHCDFVRDPECATWRTHLGMYRRTFMAHDTNQNQVNNVRTSPGGSTASALVDNVMHNVEIIYSNDQMCEDTKETEDNSQFGNKEPKDCDSESSRKCSERVGLPRQLSCGSYRSAPENQNYYPFPQLKGPRKSEAARRLGLYSSF